MKWWQEYLPKWLQAEGPYDLMWWQVAGLLAGILIALAIGAVLSRVLQWILTRIARRTRPTWDDMWIARMHGPFVLFWAVTAYRALRPVLELPEAAEDNVTKVMSACLFITLFWAVIRTLRVVQDVILSSDRAQREPNLQLLVPQIGSIARAILIAILFVSLLAQMGYHVASLITGLGIGGIAIALAAQSSLQNLLGSVGIAADKPFELGHFVRIGTDYGTVEKIGLRSTRVRTLGRTVISFPNGDLANREVESFGPRDRIRLHCFISLLYSSTSEQVKQVVEGCEQVIRDHPKGWQESIIVKLADFGESAVQIEVMCWFTTTDYNEFRQCRHEALLGFMKVVEESGTEFAFPTRTIHMASEEPEPEPESESPQKAAS